MPLEVGAYERSPPRGNQVSTFGQGLHRLGNRAYVVEQRDLPGFRLCEVVADTASATHRGFLVHLVAIALQLHAAVGLGRADVGGVVPIEGDRATSQARGPEVRVGQGAQQGLPVLGNALETGQHGRHAGSHARGIVVPGMVLHQKADAVAKRGVNMGEAGRVNFLGHAQGGIVRVVQDRVEIQRRMAAAGQLADDVLQQEVRDGLHIAVRTEQGRVRDGHVVAVANAIGDMQVQRHVGVPALHQPQHGLHFRGLSEHPVAVEVDALRGGAVTLLERTILVRTQVTPPVFMAVDIEDGHKHDGEMSQGVVWSFGSEQLTQQDQPGVLAIDFPGVGATDDQHHGVLLAGLGHQSGPFADDQCPDGSPLCGTPHGFALHPLRVATRPVPALLLHFVVTARFPKVRGFGHQRRPWTQRRRHGSPSPGGGPEKQEEAEQEKRVRDGHTQSRRSAQILIIVQTPVTLWGIGRLLQNFEELRVCARPCVTAR